MASIGAQPNTRNSFQNIISDLRFLQIFGQIIFIILVLFAVSGVLNSIISALASRNLTPNFVFLNNRAGFAIAGAEGYSADDSFWAAYMVGVKNTLVVVAAGLVGTTILGILAGIFLLSGNWLIRTITRFIVEILRNTPLLVQIIIWYFFVLSLPALNQAIQLPRTGLIALPIRFGLYLIVALIAWRYLRGLRSEQRDSRAWLGPLLISAAVAIEIGFAFFYKAADSNLFNAGLATSGQMIYVLVSVLLVVVLAYALRDWRSLIIGLGVGQLLGGLLYFFGVAPETALIAEMKPLIYLSNRGLVSPEIHATARFAVWFLFVVIGLTVAVLLFVYLRRQTEQTGTPYPRMRYAVLSLILFSVIGWFVVGAEPLPAAVPVNQNGTLTYMPLDQALSSGALSKDDQLQYATTPITVGLPQRAGLRFSEGTTLDQRYIALLLALVIYTASFIAEIVRAGILAVPRGQIEAARALGLSGGQMLYMVVLPQALRVIIPPLGNQYLNLAKNSSLALAIAYSDIFAVMNTVINQSGQSVTGVFIIMVSYLVISLTIAAAMNWINGRFQLVTR
jgi:His/Glu/Gln/Arg/opine family amino acid ABC transporter permease subunit